MAYTPTPTDARDGHHLRISSKLQVSPLVTNSIQCCYTLLVVLSLLGFANLYLIEGRLLAWSACRSPLTPIPLLCCCVLDGGRP